MKPKNAHEVCLGAKTRIAAASDSAALARTSSGACVTSSRRSIAGLSETPPPSLATRLTRPFFHLAAHALPFLGRAVFAADTPAAKPFALKPNTLWVMAGDSITAQRQHSNYLEAFYRTRFPALNVQFRNSGIGGNTTGSVLARFGYDIADWKPSVVCVELGMNDVGGGDDPSRYIDGMRQLLKKIREIPATPVLISSSPVNDGSTEGAWQSDRCRRIQTYTEALLKLAGAEHVLVLDR